MVPEADVAGDDSTINLYESPLDSAVPGTQGSSSSQIRSPSTSKMQFPSQSRAKAGKVPSQSQAPDGMPGPLGTPHSSAHVELSPARSKRLAQLRVELFHSRDDPHDSFLLNANNLYSVPSSPNIHHFTSDMFPNKRKVSGLGCH